MGDIQLINGQRELFPKHQFLVLVAGGWSATFQKMSELSLELTKIEYHEGGNLIPWKLPGRASVPDITLERGASTSSAFYNWMKLMANISAGGGSGQRGTAANANAAYRKQIKILQLDRSGNAGGALRIWELRNAWPVKFVAGDWDASTDDVVIESLTLAFDSFRKAR